MNALADLLICLRFFSRLPVPETQRERALGASGFALAASMAPAAGLLVALCPAALLALAGAVGLPPLAASSLAIAALVALTGALHEDALADCADGFGGGRDRERKLAIMRDSRIGAFGATAIGIALLLRTSALAAAVMAGRGSTALIAAATLSRAACLVPLALLPPARADGAGAAATVTTARMLYACALAVAVVIALAATGHTDPRRAVASAMLVACITLAMTMLAWRQIRGQTGDVAGATQQIAEIAVLLVYAAGSGF